MTRKHKEPTPEEEAIRHNQEGVARATKEKEVREKLAAKAAIVPPKDPRIC